MKKIMFSTIYGLEQAVLNGTKTMTRRICQEQNWSKTDLIAFNGLGKTLTKPSYLIGEIVAIAQSYKTIDERSIVTFEKVPDIGPNMVRPIFSDQTKGWNNKMFVQAALMPYQICITDIKVERLQDISDEDCMAEGIEKFQDFPAQIPLYGWKDLGLKGYPRKTHISPRGAFRHLIEQINGKGTWERNPWVFAYTFKLLSDEETN